MVRIILLVSLLLVSGCANDPIYKDRIVTVEVPVKVYPKAQPIPPKPVIPLKTLTKNSSDDAVAKAYVASVEVLNDYADALVIILKSYNTKPGE